MEYATIIVSILSSLGIGSALGQFLAGGRDRREVRSHVLAMIEAVERARWKPHYSSLHHAIRNLESAGLVARLPRAQINRYTTLARSLPKHLRDSGDPEIGFYIHPDNQEGNDVAEQARAAAKDLVDLIWAPWRTQLRLKVRRSSPSRQ